MVLCNKDCIPCCDFCLYSIHEKILLMERWLMARQQDVLNIQILNIKKQQKMVNIVMISIALEQHKRKVLRDKV